MSFVPIEQVEDFKTAIEELKITPFQKAWLDSTERIRRGFAWLDVRSIVKSVVGDKGAEGVVDLISKMLKLAEPYS